ncbi:MAG: hypothetical protein ACLQMS_14720 [Desulfomonilaceae bacterium]
MRKYSPILGLMIIVTAMMIFQVGTHEISSSTVLTTLQYNQIDQGSGEWSGMPDLKTVDWSRTTSVENRGNFGGPAVMLAEAEEEGHGSEASEEGAPGGFDRLWDVVSNG